MMKHHLLRYVGTAVGTALGTALIGIAVLPISAMAQSAPAYTAEPSEIYAGPDGSYPAVASVDGGTPVTVMGCVSGYTWCDVAMPGLRGWIYGGDLNYYYQGGPVPLLEYGPRLGLPIIGFSIGNYWDHYYRGQPWFGDRDRWEHRGPPGGYGGPPRGYGGPGPGRPDYGQHWDNRGGPPPGGNFRGDQRFDHGPGPGGEHRGPGAGENRGPGPGGNPNRGGPGPGGENHGGPPQGGHGGPAPGGPGPGGGHGGGEHGGGPGGPGGHPEGQH